MKIIVGLGNPGVKYENTRHNAGFMALDWLAEKNGLTFSYNKKFSAEIAKTAEVTLIKPQTFMNNSGKAGASLISYYKLLPKKFGFIPQKNQDLSEILTIIHDDLDIELGKSKISINSRSAGHNGVQSIINYLKTANFKRIRIGIKGNKPEQMPGATFVLQRFTEEELETIKKVIGEIII
jgi:PTH1 family peptidyl-tRNA hydrolase